MRLGRKGFLLLFFITAITLVYGQERPVRDYNPIQFSGRVVIEKQGKLEPLPFTNIAVKGTPRGTSSNNDGFYSLVVLPGETVLYSRLGLSLVEYTIPEDLKSSTHSKIVVMQQDTLFLPGVDIYPWPDKDFFKIEFIALEVDEELEEIAQRNLSPEKMARLREILPVDGREVSGIELRQLSQAYYFEGQYKPQNIFNPLSWKKFIDAIKRGDFKKKDNQTSE